MNHALRQGDVLIRPITEKIEAQTSDIDWDTLNTIWDARLKQVENNKAADRDAAMAAIVKLYQAYGRPAPRIFWHDGTALDRNVVGTPLRAITDAVLYALWFKFPDMHRIAAHMGYDPMTGIFRIANNKRLLSHNFRLRGRIATRPPWTHDLGNMISQFDVPAVVLYEFAKASKINIDRHLGRTAEALKEVLDTTFATILFNDSCVLLDRPSKISLDPAQSLSATLIDPVTMQRRSTACPAYQSRTAVQETIFAVNGIVIPVEFIHRYHSFDNAPGHIWRTLGSIALPRVRSAMIGYFGWERFLEIVPKHAKALIDHSRYGDLYMIECDMQNISVVHVTNSSPEPDGTYRRYVIPVDNDCRPLPNPASPSEVMGAPQARTALNAVASTFGMTGAQYRGMLGAES
jgi:hypothetical protein